MPTIELNGAAEALVGAIREGLLAAQKSRTLRFPASQAAPSSSEIPTTANRSGKLLGFDQDGLPVAVPRGSGPIVTKTADYTATGLEGTILADTTGGNIEITLPPAVGAVERVLVIKKIAAANTVTITPDDPAQQIDGAADLDLTASMETARLQSDGAQWWRV